MPLQVSQSTKLPPAVAALHRAPIELFELRLQAGGTPVAGGSLTPVLEVMGQLDLVALLQTLHTTGYIFLLLLLLILPVRPDPTLVEVVEGEGGGHVVDAPHPLCVEAPSEGCTVELQEVVLAEVRYDEAGLRVAAADGLLHHLAHGGQEEFAGPEDAVSAEDRVGEQVTAAVVDVVEQLGFPVGSVLQVERDLLRAQDWARAWSHLEPEWSTLIGPDMSRYSALIG